MSIKGNWRRHGSEVVIRWCQRFFLVATRLAFAASPLNSVAPNEKKYLWHPGYNTCVLPKHLCFIYYLISPNK